MAILLVLAAAAAFAVLRLLAPFLLGIVTAVVLALVAYPHHARFQPRVGNPSLAAFLSTTAIFVGILIPFFGILVLLVQGLDSALSAAAAAVENLSAQEGRAWEWLVSKARVVGMDEQELSDTIGNQLERAADALAGQTFDVLSSVGAWLAQGAIGLFTLFYLLRDGDMFSGAIRWLIPLDTELTEALLDKTNEVVHATIFGTIVVAIVQGALGGLLFWLLGLPGPALWGAVMAFFSLLPAVGPPVVWAPTAAVLVATGDYQRAVILVAFGVLVVGTIDNVLRAVFIGQRAQLHPLVVFFSVLGGVVVFGTAGFLLGPIIFVLGFSVLEIARITIERSSAPERSIEREAVLTGVTVSGQSQEPTKDLEDPDDPTEDRDPRPDGEPAAGEPAE